ncbi:RHS repeat-associated core domain-containing protein [Xenorhabdus bovienii]|nr:RHS repeat-associated core domain-containing protein [Xenorhabdus bovienii]MDE1485661.1 RHS repeat-associated core domain-containing protein [Xenorhabdus bovienii]MDE9459703.1 RHS repeat-associated core domain-containing protein [Xenorhabdus bovienii]MDE9476364.1 RHS repeat-associated core domain-containing protein [Xenorhabdus bovienii]MDE9488051.1 RHS repeat-associated core domain-containing protein [Xenorhabdus bovienii]MDE9516032.1 RHS repeat-associated core domain-containing protein [X
MQVWTQWLTTWGKAEKSQVIASNNPDYHVNCNLRFCGQYEDEESGLYYNRFRYYSPDTAQYISADPIGLLAGFNPYSYVHNPSNWIDPDSLAGWEKAPKFYDKIRADPTDIPTIATNTGWKESHIARIKDHVFFKEHQLRDGIGRFDADPGIVNSWERLKRGDHVKSDSDLLRHEYFESRFEGIFRTDYDTAHKAAVRSGRDWNP